uniref:Trichome birefringence-like N-terminal domain-containing protein n=1 Tax=Oryza meridionalis TaxID=40149 RepID=A0A0E0E0F6_9ORYZ
MTPLNNLCNFRRVKKQYYNPRCLIPAVSLLLLVVILTVSNTYFPFPMTKSRTLSTWLSYSSFSSSPGGRKADDEACNIFRGEWVPDPDAPYYTNDTCSVIHEHYDCMKYGKPDLGFVKWRWRPDGCDLPRLGPERFLSSMRGKTLAFIGDSLARNHMNSLICLLTRVAEPTTSWPSSEHTVYHYGGGYNFTVLNFWAPFLVRSELVDADGPAHTGLWNLYLDEPDAVWAPHVPAFDYAVVSASSWFYRPSMLYEAGRLVGCHHCLLPNVTDLTLRYALRMATRAALRAVVGGGGGVTTVLRTVSPSQYEGGEWNKDGNCVRTRPYRRGEKTLQGVELDFHTLQVEEFEAAKRVASGGGARMMLMDTTQAMILRADAHPSRYRGWTRRKGWMKEYFSISNDCVHWSMMKFHEVIKLPSIAHYGLRYVLPAAAVAACVLVLAAVSLPGRVPLTPVLAPEVLMNTADGVGGDRSGCDIFKGEWVPDMSGEPPPYTGESCPVIHGHYDCMRYGRPDLGYVRWRWRPDGGGCELRRFDTARFLAAMRGRSVAFVGDSLARNQMHSLVCLLSRAERPAPWTNGSYAYRFERHGLTVAAFWSPFLVRAVETDPDGPTGSGAGLWSLHLDEPDAGWAAHVGAFDHVVVSAGSWFYRPSMFYDRRGRLVGCNTCLSPNVTDLTLRYSLRMAFRSALRAAATGGARRRGGRAARRTVIVRTISPSHYENGTWNGDGDCLRTRPARRGEWELNAMEKDMRRIQVEEFAAAAKTERKRGKDAARMMLMDATEAMAQRPDAHPSKYRLWQPDKFKVSRDCVHWCLPGAMDACNDMLFHMLIG